MNKVLRDWLPSLLALVWSGFLFLAGYLTKAIIVKMKEKMKLSKKLSKVRNLTK